MRRNNFSWLVDKNVGERLPLKPWFLANCFMVKMTNMRNNSTWRDDDLEGGLAADLFNLSGLGVEESQIGAYDMRYDLFKCVYLI